MVTFAPVIRVDSVILFELMIMGRRPWVAREKRNRVGRIAAGPVF